MTRPSTGKAAVFVAPNRPFEIRDYPLRPAAPGEVLVKITMATICGSDVHTWQGRRAAPSPAILGHEIIGSVEELGEGVGKDMLGEPLGGGQRITWTIHITCGQCYYCGDLDMPQKCLKLRKYGHGGCAQDPHFTGGFAEYVYVMPGSGILRLPDDLGDAEASPVNCGVATMVSVTETAAIKAGDTVVIQGLGLLGLYAAALARAKGAGPIIGLDGVGKRLALAARFGVDIGIDISGRQPGELIETVLGHCRPDGADAVIEVCGDPAAIPQGLAMLRAGGRYVTAGLVFAGAEATIDANVIVNRCLTVTGNQNYHPRHLVEALDFVNQNSGLFPFADLVDARYPLAEIDRAFEDTIERRCLRAAIVP